MTTPATAPQVMLLARLMDSSVWTEWEKEAVAQEVADGLTKARASRMIDRVLEVMRDRKAGSGSPEHTESSRGGTTPQPEATGPRNPARHTLTEDV